MEVSRRGFLKAGAWGIVSVIACGATGMLGGCGFAQGDLRSVQDMYGRTTYLPKSIERLFCSNPIGTVDMYMLAPEKLAGWNFRPSGANKQFIEDEYFSLPSLGVWMGAGSVPNSEEIAALDPAVILCYWTNDSVGADMADDIQNETGFPVLLIDYDIRATPQMFRYVGELVGASDRAETLARYCEQKLRYIEQVVSAIPADQRKRIYLAQGVSGLTTDPVGSMHVDDMLAVLGTENVAYLPGTEGKGMGMPSVNLEQIISWNPDAVFVAEYSMSDSMSSDTYGEIVADRNWNNVACVAAGEIYRIPQSPFSWFGRPPSAMRILGCLWLLKVLYPGYVEDLDIQAEAIGFYDLFLNYSLDASTLEKIFETAQ